ncbi:MAG: hypothetical protein NTU41_04400 [Chloroflexi bacterium]|nr:hypothetical protein [Chloroflexota bacterium]
MKQTRGMHNPAFKSTGAGPSESAILLLSPSLPGAISKRNRHYGFMVCEKRLA